MASNYISETALSFIASKLAPTKFASYLRRVIYAGTCGSRLAGDGVLKNAKRPRGSHHRGLFIAAGDYAALVVSTWLSERFSALNSALKLAVVMFSSIPTPCTARSPFTRSSI